MAIHFASPAAIAVGLLFLPGCLPAKLNETRTLKLDEETVATSVDLPAIQRTQKITVEFTSSATEVSVLVFKEADAKGEDGMRFANPEKALGKVMNSKGATFTAEVPENTATRVVVRGGQGKKTEVTLKLTN